MCEDIVFRRWSEGDDAEALTELLHRAYRPLLEAGMRYTATHQTVEVTLKRMSHGECWVVVNQGEIVGTGTLYEPWGESDCEFYCKTGVAVFGQFAISPELQGKGIGRKLVGLFEDRSREFGAKWLACDTSEHADHLIAMYQRWGFELVGRADYRPHVNYESVILAKRLID